MFQHIVYTLLTKPEKMLLSIEPVRAHPTQKELNGTMHREMYEYITPIPTQYIVSTQHDHAKQ